jgi:hypothetical protein
LKEFDIARFGSPNIARMPSLLRPAVGGLLAAVCILVALAVPSAHAQAGIEVTIQPPNGGQPASILTTDVTGDITASYKIRAASGGAPTIINVIKGVSLRQLLEKTGTDFGFETIEVKRPDGSTLTITKDQVEDPRNQPVFYVDENGVTNFIGPRVGGASVVESENYFPVSGPLTFTQQAQSKLKVSISPKKKKIELGGSVRFQATVSGQDAGETIAYTWGINGKKQTQGGSRFTQKFPSKDGVYEFLVAARIEGSDVSTAAVAKITVGDPDKADDEQTGSGDATDGSGSGTGTGTGTGGSGYDSGSTYTPSYTPTPSPAPAPTPPPTPSTPPADVPDIATSGTTVEGNLLADVSDPPPSSILESAARAAREGKQSDDESAADGAGVSEAALSIAGVLALLALGAGIETREGRLPRWRAPHLRLPRRAA